MNGAVRSEIPARLVETLYAEALVLADEVRSGLMPGAADTRPEATPYQRVALACETLKCSTRLMTVITWLLSHRAQHQGESLIGTPPELGIVEDTQRDLLALLPDRMREALLASIELYERVRRLDGAPEAEEAEIGARALMDRLERSF